MSPLTIFPISLTITTAKLAISDGVAYLSDGEDILLIFTIPSDCNILVAVGPGAIELTTIPYWLNFFAIPRVNPCIAHLAILYAETAGLSADEEDIFKIFPLIPFSIIYLDTISDKKYVPFKLVFITES